MNSIYLSWAGKSIWANRDLGIFCNLHYLTLSHFHNCLIWWLLVFTWADRAIVFRQRGLVAMKSAKGVKPPFNRSKHLGETPSLNLSGLSFTFNIFIQTSGCYFWWKPCKPFYNHYNHFHFDKFILVAVAWFLITYHIPHFPQFGTTIQQRTTY